MTRVSWHVYFFSIGIRMKKKTDVASSRFGITGKFISKIPFTHVFEQYLRSKGLTAQWAWAIAGC